MSGVDYAFVSFSGHGEHVAGGQLSETRVCLTSTEDCPVDAINPRNRRHFAVVDTCRTLVVIQDLVEVQSRMCALANAKTFMSRAAVRAKFDEAVQAAEEGRVVVYSCKINQSAGDPPGLGGIFTSALIGEAGRMAIAATPGQVLSIPEVFAAAAAVTTRKNYPQQPELDEGRRRRSFPFAIGT